MNNDIGERAEKTLEFRDMLARRTGLEIVMWDERLTTVEAHRTIWRAACEERTVRSMWTNLQLSIFFRVI